MGAGFQPSILSNAERISKDAANATNLGRIASFDTASAMLQPTQDAWSHIRPKTKMLPELILGLTEIANSGILSVCQMA